MENKRVEKLVIEGVTYVPEGEQITISKEIGDLNDMIGKKFFFRTVTYHFVGMVVKRIENKFFQLEKASWVADSGRFMNAIKTGSLKEVEPLGTWFINLDTVTDFGLWTLDLPEKQI